MDIIFSAVKEIFSRRFRHSLTILAIAVSITAVVIIGAIGEAGKSLVSHELDSLGLDGITIGTTTDTKTKLTENELKTIKEMANVESATPIVTHYSKSILCHNKTDCLVWGIDSGGDSTISLKLLHGKSISQSDVAQNRRVCLVDRNMALDSYGRENVVGKQVEVLLNGRYIPMEIIGVVQADSSLLQSVSGYIPSFLYMPYTSLLSITDKTDFSQIAVQLSSNCDTDSVSGTIVSKLSANGGSYYSENLAKQRSKLTNLLNVVTMVLSAIGFISLIVAGLGIMTSMIVSVKERTREIGIKKAIGAQKSSIMIEFLAEAAIISLIGCAAGIIFGEMICFAGSLILSMEITAPANYLIMCLIVSLVCGLLFGVYPASKAARLKPVDALKCE